MAPTDESAPESSNAAVILADSMDATLRRVDVLLEELGAKQEMLLENIEQQNSLVSNNEKIEEVHKTMIRTHQYYKKLLQIKKDIAEICTKSHKLKGRARKLEKQQVDDAEFRRRRMILEEQRDQKLIARPAKSAQK